MKTPLFLILASGLCLAPIVAQEPAAPESPPPAAEATPAGEENPPAEPPPDPPAVKTDPVLKTLRGLTESMEGLREEAATLRQEVEALKQAGADPSEINEAEAKLKPVTDELAKLQSKFEELATGTTQAALDEGSAEQINLQEELQTLLEPMVYELRKTTARPREIERLRADVADFERRQKLAADSLARLEVLLEATTDPVLKADLEKLRESWVARKAREKSELETAQFQLEESLASQDSLLQMLGRVLSDFLARRGKSFLFALLGGIGTFFLFVLLVRAGERYLPANEDFRRSLTFRLTRLILMIVGGLCAVFAFLGILYSQADWLLLGLSLIFILGFLWAAKQALLPFYEQLKTILNLGPVREGERVIFDGIPWEVKSINFYTDLVNPMLTGGHVRVALADLTSLHSRPKARKEPLFPCKVGEWVGLSDGTYGEVISQTPELVRLRTVPGSVVSYQTASFLGLAPDNHSENFGLRVPVGIDYQHQSASTTEIREILEDHIKAGLADYIGADNIKGCWVEFSGAGASSLDYTVGVSLSGKVAGRKPALQRAVQRLFVDACNENGWVIPFTQVTIHQAS